MASIKKYTTKDGQKRYMFRLYLGIDPQTGKKKQTTRRGFKTQKQAKMEISRLELEIEQGGIKQESNITFSEVFDAVLTNKRLVVRDSTYINVTKCCNKHLIPEFGDKRIRTITIDELQHFVNDMFTKRKDNNLIISYLRATFRLAEERGYIDKNPCRFINVPHKRKMAKKKYYTRDELNQFFATDYLNEPKHARQYAFFRTLAFTGMRLGEALALKFSAIDFKHKVISVNSTVTLSLNNGPVIAKPKTSSSIRQIPIDDKTSNVLLQQLNKTRKLCLLNGINKVNDQFVFTSQLGKPMSAMTVNRWMKDIYKDNPQLPKITIHGFRHTHASMLFASGVPAKQIQIRLGHSSIKTTLDIYTHVSDNQNFEAVDKLTKFIDL